MNTVLIIVGTLFSAGLVLMLVSLRHAPLGYEDGSGFNFGVAPDRGTPQMSGSTVTPSEVGLTVEATAPEAPCHKQLQSEVSDTKTIRFHSGSPGAPKKTDLHYAA